MLGYNAPFASKVHNFLLSRQRLHPAVGAPHTDSQCLPVSEILIISTLATAKPRAEAGAEADSKHFDTNGAFHSVLMIRGAPWYNKMLCS